MCDKTEKCDQQKRTNWRNVGKDKKKGMEEREDKSGLVLLWFMCGAEQSPMGWVLPVCGQEREQRGSAGARGSSDC